ncbi:MAG: hypothetical protein U1F68_04275 [Gammaproteobacteria bacterium]
MPETLALAQRYRDEDRRTHRVTPGYRYRRVEVNGRVRQRWLIITSVHALARAANGEASTPEA